MNQRHLQMVDYLRAENRVLPEQLGGRRLRLGHRLKLDPKVTADQRGHGVGVAIEEYTKTSV